MSGGFCGPAQRIALDKLTVKSEGHEDHEDHEDSVPVVELTEGPVCLWRPQRVRCTGLLRSSD